MKELPYFRFTVQEWQNGDITLEDYENQGIFINICCYYWISDCSITLAKLKQRLKGYDICLHHLIESGVIKHDAETDYIEILFLDEQFDLLSEKRKKRQKAGKMGGKQKATNAKAKLKQKPSYKDKDKDNKKDKDNLEKRTQKFKSEIFHKDNGMYSIPMLTKFFEYWTEPNKSKTKMRFELEKTWDTSRRLRNWASRDINFNKGQTNEPKPSERSGNLPHYTPPETGELPTEDDMKEIEEIKKSKGLA